jgi:phage tail sheath gpL-like
MSGSTTPQINFATIPVSSLLVPGVYAEITPPGTSGTTTERALLIGTMATSGTATPNVPVLLSGASNANALFGIGSVLAQMTADYRNNDSFGELWALPIAIPTTGTAPTATLTLTGPATQAGNLYLSIGGQLVTVAVSAGDTATVMATNAVAAMAPSLYPTLPVTAAAAAGVVTLTAKDRSIAGSDIPLYLNYLGNAAGQVTPAGVTAVFSVANMSSTGVANPSIATGLANLGAAAYDFIISGFNDATNLGLIASFLSQRWQWSEEIFGQAVTALNANLSTQTALTISLNSQFLSVFGVYGTSWPAYRAAADIGAVWATSCRASPALPVQNIAINTPSPQVANQFTISERQTALADGAATIKSLGNASAVERMVTTYLTNPAGVPDDSFQNVETLQTLTYIIRDLRNYLGTAYARKILVVDGTPISGGSFMTTAQNILADVISRYQVYCNAGVAQAYATFAANATAQNQGNGVVALQLPIIPAGQLRVIAMQIDFQLSA